MKTKLYAIAMVSLLVLAGCMTAPTDDTTELELTTTPTDTADQAQQMGNETIVECDSQPAATPQCPANETTTETTESTESTESSDDTTEKQSTTTDCDCPEKKTTEQTKTENTEETTDSSTDSPEEETTTEDTPDDAPTDETPPEEQTEDTTEESPDDTTDEPTEETTEETTDKTTEETPDQPTDEQPTDETTDETPANETTDDTPSNETTDETPDEPPSDDTNTNVPDGYAVRIIYDGEWTGAYGSGGSVQSVSGSGTTVYAIDANDPFAVSVNAQKQDTTSETLTVQVLLDGEVVQESTTSAEYGVAQATYSAQTGDGGEDKQSPYSVRISYDGEWSGAYGSAGELKTVDGTGTETFAIDGDSFVISINAQKMDGGSGTLTVQILKNGEVIKESSTSAEYGVASTSASV